MTVKLGLVGIGTVGGGCVNLLRKHGDDFKRHYGVDLELVQVCSRTLQRAVDLGVGDIFTLDYNDIINNPDIDIVIELIGGTTTAREVVVGALRAGKHVVTANKALMATYGEEIMRTAREANCEISFEASVGGGIPIICPMKHALISNEITSVIGIVNGTTNYMLTRMSEDGLSYEEALREAQDKGFAEADPTADVDGLDAAAKIAILASIAFNSRVTINDVHAEGIRNISTMDLDAAHDMGYCVKLLALAHRRKDGIDVRVHPTMLPLNHQLATVNGEFNAIYITGDSVGETMFFGRGAGAFPTASAVMGDVLETARHIIKGAGPLVGCTCTDTLPLVPMDALETKYYIRFTVTDRPGVLAAMASVFAKHDVSLFSVVQRGKKDSSSADLVYVTHTACEASVHKALAEIAELEDVAHGEPSLIRVEDK